MPVDKAQEQAGLMPACVRCGTNLRMVHPPKSHDHLINPALRTDLKSLIRDDRSIL